MGARFDTMEDSGGGTGELEGITENTRVSC
jgi:hypothetical protein